MEKNDVPPEISALSFEKAIEELEKLISGMESGGLPLNELVKSFERGRYLAIHCRTQLASLERKISILSRDDGNEGSWEDFGGTSSANRTPAAQTSADTAELPF